jgi:hypothetical protein
MCIGWPSALPDRCEIAVCSGQAVVEPCLRCADHADQELFREHLDRKRIFFIYLLFRLINSICSRLPPQMRSEEVRDEVSEEVFDEF